jgi:Protein trafficking PGA2
MQKGQLEKEDWIRLGLVVLAYFIARPWISELFKRFFTNKDLSEGEAVQKEWADRKAKVGPNAIRGTKSEPVDSTTVTNAEATASGSNISQANVVVNRKSKSQSPNDQKSAEEKLLDWEDEEAEPPVIAGSSGEKADVMTWLNQWDQ